MADDTQSSPPTRRFVLQYQRCIFCGHCHYNCTTDQGIVQSTDWNLATFDRTDSLTKLDKELLLCEKCGEVISTKDHIRWVARKVGPKAYANPSLALTLEEHPSVVSGQVAAQGKSSRRTNTGLCPEPEAPASQRGDIIRVLCPHCRRVTVLEEIT
jgi:hydrogenase-4 component H